MFREDRPFLLSSGWSFYMDTSFSTDGIMVLTRLSHGCMHSQILFFFFLIFHFIPFLFWKSILKNLYKIATNLLNKGVGRFMGACAIRLGWALSIPSTCRVLSPMGDIPNIRQPLQGLDPTAWIFCLKMIHFFRVSSFDLPKIVPWNLCLNLLAVSPCSFCRKGYCLVAKATRMRSFKDFHENDHVNFLDLTTCSQLRQEEFLKRTLQ